jgi:hypothetical protein
MANYRFTFEVIAGSAINSSELRNLHTEMEKYLRTVLLPTGSKIEARSHTQVSSALDEVPYAVHKHNGGNRCDACYSQSTDGRE